MNIVNEKERDKRNEFYMMLLSAEWNQPSSPKTPQRRGIENVRVFGSRSCRRQCAFLRCPTIAWTGVEPVVDVQRAGFPRDGGGHGLVGIVLVRRQENVQRRRGDDLRRAL